MNTKVKELEARIILLENAVFPDKDKVVKGRDLQKTYFGDLAPWLDKKRKDSKVFTVDVAAELEACKDHFINKKRTIATAYTWINTAQGREDKINKPVKSNSGGYSLIDDIMSGGIGNGK